MKQVKRLAIGAISTLAATACVGVSSAGATNTALCKIHQNPCAAGNQVATLHMVAKSPKFLLEPLGVPTVIICAQSLLEGTVRALGAPQIVTVTTLTWENCKIGEQQVCSLGTTRLGKIEVLKTALNLGTFKFVNIEVMLTCAKAGIFCTFTGPFSLGAEGAGHTAGAGHGMATATSMALTPCFDIKFDALYEATNDFYIVE